MTMPLTAAEIAGAGDRIGTELVFDTLAMRIWHLSDWSINEVEMASEMAKHR